jgi:phage FluMu protein Com
MKCPRCKCDDVYLSRSGGENQGIISLVATTVRCHRCCYLFSVPRWTSVPKKPPEVHGERRAA